MSLTLVRTSSSCFINVSQTLTKTEILQHIIKDEFENFLYKDLQNYIHLILNLNLLTKLSIKSTPNNLTVNQICLLILSHIMIIILVSHKVKNVKQSFKTHNNYLTKRYNQLNNKMKIQLSLIIQQQFQMKIQLVRIVLQLLQTGKYLEFL